MASCRVGSNVNSRHFRRFDFCHCSISSFTKARNSAFSNSSSCRNSQRIWSSRLSPSWSAGRHTYAAPARCLRTCSRTLARSLFLRSRFRIAASSQRHHLLDVTVAAMNIVGAPRFPFALRDAFADSDQLDPGAHAPKASKGLGFWACLPFGPLGREPAVLMALWVLRFGQRQARETGPRRRRVGSYPIPRRPH